MFVQFDIDSNFGMERASATFYLCGAFLFGDACIMWCLAWSRAYALRYTMYAIEELIDHDDSLDRSYLVSVLILRRSDGQFVAITIQINVFVSQSVSTSPTTNSQLRVWYLNQLFICSRRFFQATFSAFCRTLFPRCRFARVYLFMLVWYCIFLLRMWISMQ